LIDQEFVTRLTLLERKVDGLVKPEIPLGLSLIREQILLASATTVAFTSIPQTYRSLLVIHQARTDRVAESDNVLIRPNNDGTANYDVEILTGNGAVASATPLRATATSTVGLCEAASSRAANFSVGYVFFPGYTNPATEKQMIGLSGIFGDVSADTDMFVRITALRWRNTAAVTSLIFVPNVGPNFVTGSSFQLYGVM